MRIFLALIRLNPLKAVAMRFLTFLIVSVFFFTSPVRAACYSPAQAEAEQGIRIHSELMVIGLNCQQIGMRHGINLYGQYREFTAKHGDLFAQYESILLDYFSKSGEQKPEASLNTLRTTYANKISNEAANMRPDVFCSNYAERILKTADLDNNAVRKWASTPYQNHPVSQPLCEQ